MKRCRTTILFTMLGLSCALVVLALAAGPVLAQSAAPKPQVGPRPGSCHDGDGDGYGSPGDPSCSSGGDQDCDDTDKNVHPGAAEACNEIDDNCDGNVDEGFLLSKESPDSGTYDCQDGIDNDGDGKTDIQDPQCAAAFCSIGDPSGCSTGDPGGCCLTGASTVCKADGSGTECALLPGVVQHLQQPEPLVSASESACFDGEDNDCDGAIDHAEVNCRTAEKCDGFDNNYDGQIDNDVKFAALGLPCSVGTGVCATNGFNVCSDDGNGLRCTATPGTPGVEGPANGGKCSDGKDNDCDGLTDLADPDCQTAEKCDGKDNDGNDGADEDFTDLGAPCSNGVGACQVAGTMVCRADGSGTVCNAIPSVKSIEGPSGVTCSDGIDNDCDGTTDLADANCGTSQLAVECSLRYVNGMPGSDCEGWHTINYDVLNGGPDAVVKAELLAIGLDGLVTQAIPVSAGDQAHLVSRLNPSDYKVVSKTNAKGTRHEVFAPVPMLRVTVTDGPSTAVAYCSNIPYLDLIRPDGDIVTASDGGGTPVFVAIPRVDPASLVVKVDGVDIISGLSLDPATDFPGGPFAGNLVIGGANVSVNGLVVGSAGIGTLASNTLAFNLDGLGCGGHIVSVTGAPQAGARPKPLSAACDADDLADKANSMVFTIEVTNPAQGQITNADPTPVEGTICHGAHIAEASINGKSVDVETGQVTTPGDGVNTADTYKVTFATSLNHTDLAKEIAGTNTESFTFDPGANLLYASAADDEGNRTYDQLTFAIGAVAQPGSLAPAAQAELAGLVEQTARQSLLAKILPAAGTTVPNAFVMGMTKDAIDTYFSETCKKTNEDTKAQIKSNLLGKTFPGKEVEVDLACNPTAVTKVTDVTFDGDFTCGVTLADGLITMTAFVPTIVLKTNTYGYCCDGCDFICWSEVIVDVDMQFTIPKSGADPIRFAFPIDEGTMLNGGSIDGQFIKPSAISDPVKLDDRSEINCLSAVGQVLIAIGKGIVNFLVKVFTFGQVDGPFDMGPAFQDIASSDELNAQLEVDTFPIAIKGMKPDEGAVAATDKLLTTSPTSIDITPNGLTVALDGIFSSTQVDPDVLNFPGSVSEPAPTPQPPQPGAGNTYFVATDDIMNQLFAAMTMQGEFTTKCQDSGKTFGDFLPADCSTLSTAKKRGVCQGQKGVDCATLVEPVSTDQAIARGACFGATHDHSICASLGLGNGQATCNLTPFTNLNASQKFLFCGQLHTPPRLLLHDDTGTTDVVESDLRFNDFLVGVVLDRDGDGTLADLTTTGVCAGTGAVVNGDCKFAAFCVDFDLHANWTLTDETGKLQIKPNIVGRAPAPPRVPGAICEGGTPTIDPGGSTDEAVDGPSADDAGDKADQLTPPLQTDGFDLNGIVKFAHPRLIAIETDGNLAWQDFLGVTGDIVPLAP